MKCGPQSNMKVAFHENHRRITRVIPSSHRGPCTPLAFTGFIQDQSSWNFLGEGKRGQRGGDTEWDILGDVPGKVP